MHESTQNHSVYDNVSTYTLMKKKQKVARLLLKKRYTISAAEDRQNDRLWQPIAM